MQARPHQAVTSPYLTETSAARMPRPIASGVTTVAMRKQAASTRTASAGLAGVAPPLASSSPPGDAAARFPRGPTVLDEASWQAQRKRHSILSTMAKDLQRRSQARRKSGAGTAARRMNPTSPMDLRVEREESLPWCAARLAACGTCVTTASEPLWERGQPQPSAACTRSTAHTTSFAATLEKMGNAVPPRLSTSSPS